MIPTKRARAKALFDCGWHQRDIARNLGVNCSTVNRHINQLVQNPDPYHRTPVPGRSRAMTERDMRQATRTLMADYALDATDLQRKFYPHISVTTVKRYLCKAGFFGRVCRKKPMLKKVHVQKQRMWEKQHRLWTAQQWHDTVFSDESKYNMVGSDGRVYC